MSTSANPKSSRNLWLAVSAIVAVGAILIGLIVFFAGGSGSSEHAQGSTQSKEEVAEEALFDAANACNRSNGSGSDEFIITSRKGSIETSGLIAYVCLADKLDAPQSLRTRIANTSGIMGAQEDTVGDYLWLWSYNKNGEPPFNLTITLADEE